MFRVEFQRVFCNRAFWIAIGIGAVIALGQYIQNVVPMVQYLSMDLEKGVYPHSVFNKWMGGEFFTVWPMLFYFILPILAALPHGDSFYQDIRLGYVKNILTKTDRKTYLRAKLLAVFCSGAVVIIAPLCLNLLLSAMTLPSLPPQPSTGFFYLFDRNMWAGLYLSHPWIYTFLYILLDGLAGGLFACISLAGTLYVTGRFVVLMLPFTVQMFLYVLALTVPPLSPVSFLSPAQPASAVPGVLIGEALIVMMIVYLCYYRKGLKDEFLS